MSRLALALLGALCALLFAAPAAPAIDAPTLQRKLTREMAYAGAFSGLLVRDLDTGRTLFERKADAPRAPASVQKLYTTATALMRFGPEETLATTVAGGGFLDPDGVWRGNLYLRGGGDPTLSRVRVRELAVAVATRSGITRVDGAVLGDESLFDARRGSFDSGFAYDGDLGGILGALTVGRGFARDGAPAKEAARRLAKELRAQGVRVDGRSGAGVTPPDAKELAATTSAPMRELARLTNVPSDNFIAETLLKALGARFAGAGTTGAGGAVVREQLGAFGVHPRVVDGSGLSRANRTTPRQVVRLLERMHGQELATSFEGSLPVAGRTGTIRRRMRGTPAQDRCRAKTGTLIGVSSLAGVCTAAGGHALAFAVIVNGMSLARARGVQDRIAAALARYDGG